MKRIIVILLVLTVVISGVIASVPKRFDFGTRASTPILPLTTQTGDLVVGEGETQTIENETFILEGNITVSSGGTLIIKNSDITVNSHYKNNYWVRVYSSATLLVENSLLREGPVPGLVSIGSFGGIDDFRMGETVISPEGDGAQVILRNSTSELRTGPGPATVVTLESSYLSILFWRSFSSTITNVSDSNIIVVHMWLTGEIEENVEFSGLGGGENQSMHLSIEGGTLDIENTLVSSYSLALWVSYGETECRKNITVRDSALNEIFAVFPIGSDIRLWNMAPDYFENWNIYNSMNGSGVPWNLTLINTTLSKWKLDFHGVAEIENSNFHLDTWNNVSVTVRNSTIILHHTRGGYVKFINTVISQSLGPLASMRFLYQPEITGPNPPYVYEFENSTLGPYADLEFTNDNIYSTFKGELSVNISFDQVYWFGGTVDREYPVQVLGANGVPIEGFQLSLVKSDDTQVWSGVTDENGRASFHLVFGKDNYTENFTLMAATDNDMRKEVGFLTSTPISLTSLMHAPIYIDGNSDFASQAENESWAGNGTEENPYIIENYDINASSANGIEIRNTDKYFIIRNCTIRDGRVNYSLDNRGIYLYNVTNGKIDNVTSYNNFCGIQLDSFSDNNTVTNCYVYNNRCDGIYLYYSSNNNLSTNYVYNNQDGIGLSYSSNNTLSANCIYNNFYDGIYLWYSSSNNVLSANRVYNNSGSAIGLYESSNNNVLSANYVYDNSFYNNSLGINLYNSSHNNLSDNYVYNNSLGIYLEHSSNNTLSANNAYNNNYGVHLQSSSNNALSANNVYSNDYGIYLQSASHNNLSANNVYNNDYGIKLDSSSNNLIYNNYLNNTDNAYSSGSSGNRWNITKTAGTNIINGSYLGGNYLSDYTGSDANGDGLGDTPYIIPGDSGEQDYLPLAKKGGLQPHAPIYINGNSDFASQASSEGWAGNGTEMNPYIIENYDINASSANGIEIRNTSAYFVIRNCRIHNGGSLYNGVRFVIVTNGKINNVTSYNNYYGIYLQAFSNNSIITNCDAYNNSQYGVWLDYSSNNNIINCNFYNNSYGGIQLCYSSNNNQITNCSVYNNLGGIMCASSNNNQISNCTVHNNHDGICMSAPASDVGCTQQYSSNNAIANCAIYNNKDGIWLCYSSNSSTTNCAVYNNSDDGIWLYESSNNSIINCAVYNNSDDGIWLCYSSNNNQITNCAIYNNFEGIELDSSSDNQIHYNNVYNNTDYGVYSYLDTNDATYNWWGFASGPYHPTTNPNGTGNKVSDNVIYKPWLIEPGGITVSIPITVTATVDNREVNITGVGTGTINITPLAPPQPPPQSLQYIICINVTITGTLTYANITIKYNNSDVVGIDESTLRMYYWDGSQWQLCNNTGVDIINNIVWANVTHLTIFAPMAEKAAEVAPTPVNLFLYAGIAAIIIIVISATSLLVVVKRRKKLKEPK